MKKTLMLLAVALLALSATITPAFADGGPFIPPGKSATSLR